MAPRSPLHSLNKHLSTSSYILCRTPITCTKCCWGHQLPFPECISSLPWLTDSSQRTNGGGLLWNPFYRWENQGLRSEVASPGSHSQLSSHPTGPRPEFLTVLPHTVITRASPALLPPQTTHGLCPRRGRGADLEVPGSPGAGHRETWQGLQEAEGHSAGWQKKEGTGRGTKSLGPREPARHSQHQGL